MSPVLGRPTSNRKATSHPSNHFPSTSTSSVLGKLCKCRRCTLENIDGCWLPKKEYNQHKRSRFHVRTPAVKSRESASANSKVFAFDTGIMGHTASLSSPPSPSISDAALSPSEYMDLDTTTTSATPAPVPKLASPVPEPENVLGDLLNQFANDSSLSIEPLGGELDAIEERLGEMDYVPSRDESVDESMSVDESIIQEEVAEGVTVEGCSAEDLAAAGSDVLEDTNPAFVSCPERYKSASPQWLIRLFLLIIIFLNLRYNVGVRACAFLLMIMKLVFVHLRLVPKGVDFPITLQTSMKRLGLDDHFTIFPLCPKCYHPYKPDTSALGARTCTACKEPLYNQHTRSRLEFLSLSSLAKGKSQSSSLSYEPRLGMPIAVLSRQLERLLAHDGVEEGAESWDHLPRDGETLNDVMDGKIWRELKGPDKKPFFSTSLSNNELRLAFSISLDWFRPRSSSFSGSHSSGILSASCANLTPSIRYRVLNILALLMTPGPNEPTGDQLQFLLELVVDDLLMLYHDGIIVRTPLHPNGRLVRVAVIATICDHPAMCKMLGLADHSHGECPCPLCTITTDQLHDSLSLSGEGYRSRTDKEIRRLAEEYRALKTPNARKEFFKKHGVRWSEFHRLSYFKFSRMAIIDPMHNLLLGVVKTHWYQVWIKKDALRKDTKAGTARELSYLHDLMRTFEAPSWVSRFPSAVGEPAGGSLSADEYKFLATVLGPLTIPFIWDKFLSQAEKDYPTDVARYQKAEKEAPQKNSDYLARLADFSNPDREGPLGRKPQAPPSLTKPERPRMLSEEPEVFLMCSKALTVLLSSSVRRCDLEAADADLRSYLRGFQKLYPLNMTPNHHWALHTRSFIEDYGPVYGFWAFLSERLNYHLKKYNTNQRDGGQLEISMMRSFMKDAMLGSMLSAVANSQASEHPEITQLERTAAETMARLTNAQSHGAISNFTTDDSSREPQGEDHELSVDHSLFSISLSPTSTTRPILCEVRSALVDAYNTYHQLSPAVVDPSVRSRVAGGRQRLTTSAEFHTYMVLNGRRVVPLSSAHAGKTSLARSSLVRASLEGRFLYGEVLDVFEHKQQAAGLKRFAHVRWMRPAVLGDGDHRDFWADHRDVLDIQHFQKDAYLAGSDTSPSIIPLEFLDCPLIRMTLKDHWLTLALPKHGPAT